MDPLGSWGREVLAHRKRERFSRQKKNSPTEVGLFGKTWSTHLAVQPMLFYRAIRSLW